VKLQSLTIRGSRAKWAAVGLAGLLAVSARSLDRLRLPSLERLAVDEFLVTSGADSGPGSLREGIFAADRAGKRARIVVVASQIVIETPLPPLVNPNGIVIDASRSHARLIVSSPPGSGPIIDVTTENSEIVGLRIAGAPDEAILVRVRGTRLQDVTIEKSRGGVYVADSASDFSVSDSLFRDNAVGIRVPSGPRGVFIQNNRFERHRQAAIWAVAPAPDSAAESGGLIIARNHFTADERSLLVINVGSRIERNQIDSARSSAIQVSGAPAVLQANRIRAGFGFGIEALDLASGLIADNEIDHNCAGGILIRASRNTSVTANRVYANATGIVVVYGNPISPTVIDDNLVTDQMLDGLQVIGGSPILRRNQLLQNHRAALRLSSSVDASKRVLTPDPRLDSNIIHGNGSDEPQHDNYRATSSDQTAQQPGCSWRLGRTDARLAFVDATR
jgi:hypothetical protein